MNGEVGGRDKHTVVVIKSGKSVENEMDSAPSIDSEVMVDDVVFKKYKRSTATMDSLFAWVSWLADNSTEFLK